MNASFGLKRDRWSSDVPRSKRLATDENSNILVFMTGNIHIKTMRKGHGGEDFLKFQDTEEISSFELADVFHQMYEKKRYNEILFMIDTCKANSMFSHFYSPNIIAMGSSERGQNSYSVIHDRKVYFSIIWMKTLA